MLCNPLFYVCMLMIEFSVSSSSATVFRYFCVEERKWPIRHSRSPVNRVGIEFWTYLVLWTLCILTFFVSFSYRVLAISTMTLLVDWSRRHTCLYKSEWNVAKMLISLEQSDKWPIWYYQFHPIICSSFKIQNGYFFGATCPGWTGKECYSCIQCFE